MNILSQEKLSQELEQNPVLSHAFLELSNDSSSKFNQEQYPDKNIAGQLLSKKYVGNHMNLLFLGHLNNTTDFQADEEEKQPEFEVQQKKQDDDISSATKNRLIFDSESTQPTQKLQINFQQDSNISYSKSFDEATFLKNQGNQSFKQLNFCKAIEQYNLALGFCDPQFLIKCPNQLYGQFQKLRISILLHLSSCYLNIGNPKQCIYHADLAIQLDPLNSKVWYKRAIAHQQQSNYENAFRDIDQAWNLVKQTTQDPEIFRKREEIIGQRGCITESQKFLQQAYNQNQHKTNQFEFKSITSDFNRTSSYASGQVIANRYIAYSNSIWKITASALIASWITQYYCKERLISKNGLIKVIAICFSTASCMIVGKKWKKLTLATVTLGILAFVQNRKKVL